MLRTDAGKGHIMEEMSLCDMAYQSIRRDILREQLKPGYRLREREMVKTLRMSRTPIRRAFQMLEKEGLIISRPGRGATVADISGKELKKLLEIQSALEGMAIMAASQNLATEKIDALFQIERRFEQEVAEGTVENMAYIDEEFHEYICCLADNEYAAHILGDLKVKIFRYRLEYLRDESARFAEMEEHRKIINCLCRGQKMEAKDMLHQHIGQQRKVLMLNFLERKEMVM